MSLAEAQPGRGLNKAGRAQWAEAAFFRGLAVGGARAKTSRLSSLPFTNLLLGPSTRSRGVELAEAGFRGCVSF